MSGFEKRIMGRTIIGGAGCLTWGPAILWDLMFPGSISCALAVIVFSFISAAVRDSIMKRSNEEASEKEIRLSEKISSRVFYFFIIVVFIGILFIPESGVVLIRIRALQLFVILFFLYELSGNGISLLLLRKQRFSSGADTLSGEEIPWKRFSKDSMK